MFIAALRKELPRSRGAYHGTRADLKPGEITDWQGYSAEALKAMKDFLEQLERPGVGAIEIDD